jgi:hypothetical protein
MRQCLGSLAAHSAPEHLWVDLSFDHAGVRYTRGPLSISLFMARNPDLVLVDASSYVYRAFHPR